MSTGQLNMTPSSGTDASPANGRRGLVPPIMGRARSLGESTMVMSLRTIVTMCISLYSARIVLAELGAVDYGVYFAVAGVTLLVSFLNSALATSTQRFLSVELAEPDNTRLRSVFSASLQIHAVIALLTLVAAETLGLWFVKTHMVFPAGRLDAALLAFHFAVLSTVITILQVPYNATMVAYQRFSAYAAFDIAFAVLRLMVALLLIVSDGDRLKTFAALMFTVTFLAAAAKVIYCTRAYPSCRYRLCRDGSLLRGMSGFAGWSLLGAAAQVLNIQGIGIILNLFFGPLANAAQNIALQLSNATSTLAANLQIASGPQIIMAHAAGDTARFHALVERSARFSFLLMLVLMAPMIVGIDAVLDIWLKTAPTDASGIARLLLVTALINSVSFPLMAAAQATGTIRTYQSLVGGLMLSAIPLAYLTLSMGGGVLAVFYLLLILSVLSLGVRLFILRGLVGLNVRCFLRVVVLPSLGIAVLVLAFGTLLRVCLPGTIIGELAALVLTGFATLLAVCFLGISASERMEVWQGIVRRVGASS
jgi:O-antigen/teichoic acid export membrane protein